MMLIVAFRYKQLTLVVKFDDLDNDLYFQVFESIVLNLLKFPSSSK